MNKFYRGYTGKYPQEPYKPSEPVRSTYIGTNANYKKSIYYDIEVTGDSDFDLDEYFEDHGKKRHIPDKRYWENLTLQDIVDLAPPGTKLQDIVFDLSFPRMLEYTEVEFKHIERDLDAEEKAYQKDMEKYQKELDAYGTNFIQYEKDLEAYQQWYHEQEVKELEGKLSELKNKQKLDK